ncbi:MAG TPA: glutamine amidotransferase [Gammaproteobacteria bacterium]|jgi:GMP synthase (glutamine-hydrolysing)|nr:glutamine amidotransferase [Gammaproteobacteria bacterium]
MKTLLAIRHVPFEDLDSYALQLADAGYAIRYVDAPTADFAALAKQPWDLLVVLGGPIGVNDGADFPFIAPELKFVEARLKSGAPTLGICLGSQFIARALGAKVYRIKSVEVGWKALKLTDAGRDSPLKHLSSPVFHWHGEVSDLPAGATSLAYTDITPHQGFTWGTATLAMQFHPEVSARGLEQWYVGNSGELKELDLKPGELRRASIAHAAAMHAQAAALLKEWLATIG